MDGTVARLNVEKGERVVGTNMYAGTETMVIANLHLMEVKVDVNENDIVRVKLNDTASVEVDAYQNRKFKGVVTEISTSANTVVVSADQVTNFDVKIRILPVSYHDLVPADRPNESPFRPGMSATVDIQTESVENVLSIPIQAVTARSDSALGKTKNVIVETKPTDQKQDQAKKKNEVTQEYVFIYDKGIAKLTKVKTGIQDNKYIRVTEGLKDGDEVIIAPYREVSKKLKDGDKVKKVDPKELYTGDNK